MATSNVLPGQGGHHMLLSTVADGYEPSSPVHDCDESEMTHHRLVGVASNSETFTIDAPDGVAFEAPTGQPFVIQSQYVNTTDEPIENLRNPLALSPPE